MTPINRKLVRITSAKHRGDAIVIELHPTALFVRTKGNRESFSIPYGELYEIAALRDAKRKTGFARESRPAR